MGQWDSGTVEENSWNGELTEGKGKNGESGNGEDGEKWKHGVNEGD